MFIAELDLSELGFAAAPTGRPGYSPATMLKLYLYGYLNQVQSSRWLEREAGRNIELMWLTGELGSRCSRVGSSDEGVRRSEPSTLSSGMMPPQKRVSTQPPPEAAIGARRSYVRFGEAAQPRSTATMGASLSSKIGRSSPPKRTPKPVRRARLIGILPLSESLRRLRSGQHGRRRCCG